MRLAELLGGARFPVACGLAPSIGHLDAEVDNHTLAEPEPDELNVGLAKPESARQSLGSSPEVRAVISELWDVFVKSEDCSVSPEQYKGFVRRIVRVLLPGLKADQEETVAANTWQEDARGLDRLTFAPFFEAVIRFSSNWTDSDDPTAIAAFIKDLLLRITKVEVTVTATGQAVQKDNVVQVAFRGAKASVASDRRPSDPALTRLLDVRQKGTLPKFQLSLALGSGASGPQPDLCCWWEEAALDPALDAGSADGARRAWAPLDEVIPLGHVASQALRAVEAELQDSPALDFDLPPGPGGPAEHAAAAASLAGLAPDGAVVFEWRAGKFSAAFGARQLLAAALAYAKELAPAILVSVLVSPVDGGGVLGKLQRLRQGLLLPQASAWEAALHGQMLKDPTPDLPTFPSVLKNELALDHAAGLVRPVPRESLLSCQGLSAFAEAFVRSNEDRLDVGRDISKQSSLPVAPIPSRPPPKDKPAGPPPAFTAHVPPQTETLDNDAADLQRLAHTSPVALWVLGQCDAAGDYKTEVCRRFAEKMGLEWLKPAHLLELAVKTPPNRRTPLMGRCAEQLQRGMVVSVADALGLSLELMTSARCKTNGYVLDFPPVRPEDSEAVAAFVQRVRDLSGSATVDWEAFLRDEVQLPPLAPEPEPPEPPAEEGEGEEEGGGEGVDATAEDDAAEGGGEEEEEEGGEAAAGGAGAADEPPAGGPGEGAEGEAGGEAAEGEAEPREEQEGSPDGEEGPAEPPPPPPPPPVLVPNPLANSMPRRLLVLSAETDELAGWKQVLLKLQHEEKARRRKELEAAGEEVEDEDAEEEEAAEQPALPEEEEEREELFDKNAGDVLRTMAEFVPAPPLEQPKALPPIPEVSLDPQPEPADDEALAKGHEDAVRILHVDQEVPLLSLRADGRPPSEVADLLEVAAGQLRCPRAPLPKMLEGEGAEEPKYFLRLDLHEKQVSRRWSQWRQHCPVALYDKRLVPGGIEFAAEYAGYAFCFSSAAAQRRFCAWPKLFLTDAPRINAPGMHLGYVLLSPMGFRVPELAARVSERYGFDVVDVAALVQRAVQLKASDQPPPPPQEVEGEGGQERPRAPAPEEDEEEPGAPRLLVAEKAALLAGAPLGAETLARLVGDALGIAKNTAILQKQQDDIAEAKRVLEEFAAREPPEDAEEGDAGPAAPEYELDEEGEPVIPLSEPLLVPPRGFVLTGFPGSAEQLELLRSKLRLEIERVLVVKPMAEEEPKEPAEILAELGFGQDAPMESHLESQAAGFESLAALEDLQLSDVAMEATEDEQFIQIQKAIDPFYEVADDAEVADEIPDPDEWEEPPAEEPWEGEPPPDPLELPRRPTIPWGVCGPYCPVTLKEDDWLFPGQKANQHMYKNKVYALANEAASAKFVAEPSKYVPSSGEPPIPRVRVLVTGPTGSGVERQCQLLAEACKMPVVKVEGEWRARVEARLQAARAAVKEAAAAEKLLEPLLADEGVAWPPGWTPPEPKPEGEDEDDPEQDGGGQEEKEPEEDGLDDEGREALYVAAMRDVLGSHCGACILDGTFFGDLQNEELDDGAKEARSLQQLLIKAQRIPDITIVLKCKNEVAVANALDCEAIDREYAEKKAAYEKLVAEAEEKEEDPPDPPDGLVLDADEDEKESDRAKAKFVEQKQAEQQVLKELIEALKEARGVVQKISADRGEEPTQTALRWHCRPYVEQRGSIFIKHQMAKVTPSQSLDLARRGLAQTSRFEMAGPLFMDTPLFAGRPDAYRYPTEFRRRLYYPRGTAEQEQLLERPVDFIYQPSPSRVAVHPAVAISGPPLAGKTFLARALAERTGAVYVSVPEVLERLCSRSAMPCGLSRSITEALRAGGDVPDRLLTEAVRHRLCAADVLSRGWVLDDFPSTEAQARSLSAAGIVPHRVLVLGAPAGLVLGRSRELRGRPGLGGAGGDLAQQEPPLQRLCLDAYRQRAPLLRTYYSFAFDNVRDIDASRSAWPISDHALRETSAAITQRLEYYRRTAGGLAARVYGMCLSRERLQETESDFKNYCPVTLTLSSELVQCCDPRCVVEYKSKVYWISSEDKTRSFLDDPDSFLQVPLPSALPRLLTPMERRTFSSGCELEGHCPVALLDGQELVKASGNHSAFYQLKYWTFENKEACEKFMRRPSRYAQKAKLPGKRPETQDADTQQLLRALTSLNGRTIEQDSMLTYMQSSISEIICQAMVQSGQRRPLYPGKTPQESALLFLARFLKAKNSIATDLYAAAVRAEYEEFLNDCAVPQLLNDLMQQERDGTKTWTEWDRKRFKDLKLRFDALFENVDAQASGRRRSSQSR